MPLAFNCKRAPSFTVHGWTSLHCCYISPYDHSCVPHVLSWTFCMNYFSLGRKQQQNSLWSRHLTEVGKVIIECFFVFFLDLYNGQSFFLRFYLDYNICFVLSPFVLIISEDIEAHVQPLFSCMRLGAPTMMSPRRGLRYIRFTCSHYDPLSFFLDPIIIVQPNR